ncbi:hypothetical protein POSPLADRAFT_1040902 [Postia placenta MAD-698-R-SB12]|uniref:Uncharacterized protein n=1 Tax=Postia placenta MAD-698-R-SB12 TaxID=670580 RepID=A0A1X6MSL3_9APHY|nr:hypothetical protein POSPLADRAFT_1040902 [Postia placenta MAD-698-R-SB12]OSX59163.1 hypothetical protein POSPLADRAFT_1040902 [Postia placenta MAD-698-R-SB12]
MMRSSRPPLRELPLEHFLPPDLNVPPNNGRALKRPHSPGGASLYSPAKRRMLDVTGSSANGTLSGISAKVALPGRRLDFSPAGCAQSSSIGVHRRGSTPLRKRISPLPACQLAPSPELPSRFVQDPHLHNSASHDIDIEMPDCTSLPPITLEPPPNVQSLMTPQAIVSVSRQSVHYPGFDVYQDPFDVGSIGRSSAYESANEDNDCDSDCSDATASKQEKECNKENVVPKRRGRKMAPVPLALGAAAWAKAGLLSPEVRCGDAGTRVKPIPSSHLEEAFGGFSMGDDSRTVTRCGLGVLDNNGRSSPERTPVRREAAGEENTGR